ADGLKSAAATRMNLVAAVAASSEPIGPSASLHTREFFTDCKRALKKGGVLVTQNGLPFLFPDHLSATSEIFASLFRATSPYLCTQPCYFGGPFALNWASDDEALLKMPETMLARRTAKRRISAKYYTPSVHRAAFALPHYVSAALARPGQQGSLAKRAGGTATTRKTPRHRTFGPAEGLAVPTLAASLLAPRHPDPKARARNVGPGTLGQESWARKIGPGKLDQEIGPAPVPHKNTFASTPKSTGNLRWMVGCAS